MTPPRRSFVVGLGRRRSRRPRRDGRQQQTGNHAISTPAHRAAIAAARRSRRGASVAAARHAIAISLRRSRCGQGDGGQNGEKWTGSLMALLLTDSA